jgi:hypothetical protein
MAGPHSLSRRLLCRQCLGWKKMQLDNTAKMLRPQRFFKTSVGADAKWFFGNERRSISGQNFGPLQD